MFTVFADGAALLRLVHRVDTLWDGAVGHHTVHLIIWFAAAPFTGRRLWAEGGWRRERESGLVDSEDLTLVLLSVCMCALYTTCMLQMFSHF